MFLFRKAGQRSVPDVHCGVVVGVVRPSAAAAVESCAVPVAGVHVSAAVAALAGIAWINHEDAYAVACRFVCGELLQLAERPLVEHVAASCPGLRAFGCLPADVREVFERYRLDALRVGESFGCLMVDVTDEPLFPMSHRLQPAMGASGAFFLQCLPVVRVTASDSLHAGIGGLTSSRIHGEGVLSQVNAQYVPMFDWSGLG